MPPRGGIYFTEKFLRKTGLSNSNVRRKMGGLSVASMAERAVWLEVEDAIELMGLFEMLPLPPIEHGVCVECNKLVVR